VVGLGPVLPLLLPFFSARVPRRPGGTALLFRQFRDFLGLVLRQLQFFLDRLVAEQAKEVEAEAAAAGPPPLVRAARRRRRRGGARQHQSAVHNSFHGNTPSNGGSGYEGNAVVTFYVGPWLKPRGGPAPAVVRALSAPTGRGVGRSRRGGGSG